MKRKISLGFLALLAVGSASGQGLYYVSTEAQESIPIKWVVGLSAIYDDNVSPGYGAQQSSFGLNPNVAMSFVSISPQTTWDVYVRLGLIYYFDAPTWIDTVSPQSRAGVTFVHRFSERLRFTSTNFVAYELEPDYSYGYSSSRQTGAYFLWQTDNSLGFRWTERFATYTGLRLSGVTYADVANNDRFTWEAYNQFRYQLTPQSVLTADVRYSQTTGNGVYTDADDFYLLGGIEHRFSPTTIGIIRAGAQFHSIKGGDSYTSPYLEFALNSQITQPLSVRTYARYGIEGYSNVQYVASSGSQVEFNDQRVLRVGVSAEYAISPMFSVFSGIDYLPTDYAGGHTVPGGLSVSDQTTQLFNAYIGLSVKFNSYLTGTATYNFTDSSSDFSYSDYTRNRVTVGLTAEF
jgi:hypothetical protein